MPPDSGKEYYLKHKGDNCHINVKKYLKTPAMVTAFLKQLKKPEAFQKTFRAILRDRPTTKNPMEWMAWKNRLLQHMESVAKIPDDFCELTVLPKLTEAKDESSFGALPLSLRSPLPFETVPTRKLIGNDSKDEFPLGFPVESYLWKDIISPITPRLDVDVAHFIETLTTEKELIPTLVPCHHAKRFAKDGSTTPVHTYVYALAGGFAYRVLGGYLRQLQPTLPVFEDVVTKGQDYDINFMLNNDTIDSFPVNAPLDLLQSFCEMIHIKYHSTWNKIHRITKDGIEYEVTFIKPSPCEENREKIIHSDYRYVQDRFLLSTFTFAPNNNIVNISYRIIVSLQIKTATETYCFTDHLLEIHYHRENDVYDAPYEMQNEPWFPAISIPLLLSKLAMNKEIHSIPSTKTESIYQFELGKGIYQLPNINALLLQSMNGMILRIALENAKTYKARQDYARIYTILRMLQTIPGEPILTKLEISKIYTTLQSITMHPKWDSFSDSKKKEMIHEYSPSKISRIKISFIDKLTKKPIHVTEEYYKGPYEECRVNSKEEDPLLYELGVTKFNARRAIIDKKMKEEILIARRKSCDGTASVKRRIHKAHKTRKTKRL